MILWIKALLRSKYWKYRHLFDPDWAGSYLAKINHPVVKYAAERVLALSPATVLEFGASSGPNLIALHEKLPGVHCLGLDISPAAVAAGNAYIKERGIGSVILQEGDEDTLSGFETNSFDVVLASAVLIYLNAVSVRKTIASLLRIAKKGVVIIEQDSMSGGSFFDGRNWLHDYRKIFEEVAGGFEVKAEKMPETVLGGDWGERGYTYTLRKL